jgi:hypothetical protein
MYRDTNNTIHMVLISHYLEGGGGNLLPSLTILGRSVFCTCLLFIYSMYITWVGVGWGVGVSKSVFKAI